MRPKVLAPVLAVAAALPLAGCISFGAKPPPSLLTLTTAATVPVGQTVSSAQVASITVLVPSVPQALAGARVPVQAGDTAVAYLKGALWVESPPRLFARLLSDTIAARTGRIVLSSAQSFTDPGARLSGELRNFGVDAGTSEAVVTFDAALIRTAGKAVEKQRFEVRVPLGAVAAQPVGVALNQAANTLAGQVADWVGR